MAVPDALYDLVERFDRNRDEYRSGRYNETQVRREFIDPLFRILGWDIDNTSGAPEAYKDVVHEDAIKIGGAHKAPDYSFRVGGARKFFVEAKNPSISIRNDPNSAFQLRRYAWSAKLPVSILTDFEELAVYDCTVTPDKTDRPSAARLNFLTVDQYVDQWDTIAGTFSKEAALSGSIDALAETTRTKRGTATVDEVFLKEIESWRSALATDLARNNPELTRRQLNYAVQITIDRIIFLRMTEDRGIEEYGRLQALLSGEHAYARLQDIYRQADERYNSGLFHFREERERPDQHDALTPRLDISDVALKGIIQSLYYPDSPYEFSVLPIEVLGQVYEQFLGSVIDLSPDRSVVIEEKPEVRKAGGVYYTPKYIVDYIVEQTVGRLLEGKKPGPRGGASKLRIVDPACGSGSFLIGAYEYLLDWHRDEYVKEGPEKHRKVVYQGAGGQWMLTTDEKKRILLNNIYGVDIDSQAVEVTKLSLLLKVLEGETSESLVRQLSMFRERVLPDLGNNIKSGNSLIGPDFYDNRQMSFFDEEEAYRINAFDWRHEFPHVFAGKSPGFDIVIGNPPYRRELDYKDLLDEIANTAFGRKFRTARMDLWYYFVHRGLEINKKSGLLSYIVNAYWIAGTGASKLIASLERDAHVEEIFFLGNLSVFQGVSGQHMIVRVRKGQIEKPTIVKTVNPKGEKNAEQFVTGRANVRTYEKTSDQLFRGGKVDIQPPSDELLAKIEAHIPLVSLGKVRQGIAENPASINRKTNLKYGGRWRVGEGVFALSTDEVEKLALDEESSLIRPYHDLSDIDRYFVSPSPSLQLIYSTKDTCPDIAKFPEIRRHLDRFRVIMEARRETKKGSNSWWHLHWPRDESIWKASKILSVQMARRPSFAVSQGPTYVPFSVNVFVPDEEMPYHLNYIASILNSALMWKWFSHHAKRRGIGLEINGNVLKRAPVRELNLSSTQDRQAHDKLVHLVDQIEHLKQRFSIAMTRNERTILQRQIDATDRQIDRLVYELYELTEEEIETVEKTFS